VVSRVVFNLEEAWNWGNEETVKEQLVVDEHDEHPIEVSLPAHQHLRNKLHPLLQEAFHLLGKIVAVNLPCNEFPSK